MILICGKTGTGKTEVQDQLVKMGYERIVTYTTRPKRKGEINGIHYHFVSNAEFQFLENDGFFVNPVLYNTAYGVAKYGTALCDLQNDNWNKILIVNPKELKEMQKVGSINPMVFLLKAEESVVRDRLSKRGDSQSEIERRIEADKKDFDGIEDIVDSMLAENKKLVIMARFVPEMNDIQEMLEKKGIGYAAVRGGVKDRAEEIRRFQEDDDCMVFIGQIAAAGLGITLTAASTMVFYSMDYSMSNFEQAKARIHRVSQKNDCLYIYLIAKGTVDRKVLKSLRSKVDLAKLLVDDYRKGKNPFEV